MTRVKVSAIINIKTIEGSTYMNKKEEYQEVYINLDDSGKLTKKEKVSVYAGIVFLSGKALLAQTSVYQNKKKISL